MSKSTEELTSDSNGITTSKVKHTYYTHDSATNGFNAGIQFEGASASTEANAIDKETRMRIMHRSDVMK